MIEIIINIEIIAFIDLFFSLSLSFSSLKTLAPTPWLAFHYEIPNPIPQLKTTFKEVIQDTVASFLKNNIFSMGSLSDLSKK